MAILTHTNSYQLWQDAVQQAEKQLAIELHHELEAYLITLLSRYIGHAELAKQVMAHRVLDALQAKQREKTYLMQMVGDECLLFAGLFPKRSERKNVSISYFVNLGQSAYSAIAQSSQDLFWQLAQSFVLLMDVLQTLTCYSILLPLDAYQQWNEVGSQRAYRLLQECGAIPVKTPRF